MTSWNALPSQVAKRSIALLFAFELFCFVARTQSCFTAMIAGFVLDNCPCANSELFFMDEVHPPPPPPPSSFVPFVIPRFIRPWTPRMRCGSRSWPRSTGTAAPFMFSAVAKYNFPALSPHPAARLRACRQLTHVAARVLSPSRERSHSTGSP